MARVVRTTASIQDVLAIADYISKDRPSAADRWLDQLDVAFWRLSLNPLIGEDVSHLSPGVRRQSFGSYLIFYLPIADGIEVRRVLHGARQIDDLV